MTYTVAERERVREAATEARAHEIVLAADTLVHDVDPQRTWTLELVWEGNTVPPSVLDRLARHRLHAVDVTPRGQTTVQVARG